MAKKKGRKKKPTPKLAQGDRRGDIQLPDGRTVSGIYKQFTTAEEHSNVYRLADVSSVRVRIIIDAIFVGDEELAPGTPFIVVRQAPIVMFEPPTKKS